MVGGTVIHIVLAANPIFKWTEPTLFATSYAIPNGIYVELKVRLIRKKKYDLSNRIFHNIR